MRQAQLVGRVIEPQGRVVYFGAVYYVFKAGTAMECDHCHGPIAAGDLFSRPEINQRTQRFSRVYYCRRCVSFERIEEGKR